MAGKVLLNYRSATPAPPVAPSPALFGSPDTFSSAAKTNASDYDSIMKSYDELLNSNTSGSGRINYTPITPNLAQYSPSASVTGSLANLSQLSQTGGYSDTDKADLRARGISPIRSVYANAQRKLDQNKAVQGGYSPNYTAATAKMARELSEEISSKVTDVNAGIAQNVAANKMSIAPSWASAAANENQARNAIEQSNANVINQINELNAKMEMESKMSNNANILAAIQGKQGLYGTNPALTSTFGNQVVQAAQLGQGQQQINNQQQNAQANNRYQPFSWLNSMRS